MNGFEENEGINKKQIIIVFIVAILLIALIVSVVFVSSASKKKKLQEEKAKRAESLKVEDFLTEIAKENWQEVKVKEDCQISHINPSFNGFSWIGKEKEETFQYIDGKKLNIFFKDNQGKCCGDINKFWKKIKNHFESHDFVINETNSQRDNRIYAFENDGLKCIYGYKDVINGKEFCEFGIICGRKNKEITQDADFKGVFNLLNEKPPYKIIVIDKIVETIYGKFIIGKMGFIFFNEVGDPFLVKKEINGNWDDKSYIIKRENISCDVLLEEKIPPEIINQCYSYKEGKIINYEKLYKEKYK